MRPTRTLLVLAALIAAGLLVAWLLRTDDAPPQSLELDTDPVLETEDLAPPPRTASGATSASATGTDPSGTAGATTPDARMLSGEVLDERGRSLAGARVAVRRVHPDSLRGAPYEDGDPTAVTTSERDGSFQLPAPTGTWLRVEASLAGRATVGRLVASAGAFVILRLPPAGRLHLEVVDDLGKPVPEATALVSAGETRHSATTDAKGIARLDTLPPGPALVRLLMPTHGSARAGPYLIRADALTTAIAVVPRRVEIEGTVVDDATGAAIDDAQVRIARPGQAEAVLTDAKGRFGPLTGGGVGERIFVAAAALDYAAALEPVVLRGTERLSVVIRLQRGEPWSGRVVDGRGTPVAGATVRYTADGVAAPARGTETQTDEQGRFTLGPPPLPAPGRRVVLVAESGGALGALALRPHMLAPDPLELVLLPGTRVFGRVRGAAGKPLSGVTVRLVPDWRALPRGTDPDAAASRLHAANATGLGGLAAATTSDGSWSIAHVPAGPYGLVYQYDQGVQRGATNVQVEGAAVDAGTETLAVGEPLVGEIIDARGAGVGGVDVLLTSSADRLARRSTRTDSDGHFAFTGIAPGEHTVAATVPGRPPVRERVVVPYTDGTLRIQLAEPAALQVRVTGPKGPYSGVLTLALGDAGSGRTQARRESVRVVRGEAILADVPPGTWSVEAFAPGGLRARATEVAVDPGRTSPLTLTLAVGARLAGHVRTRNGRGVAGARLVLTHTPTGGRLSATAGASGAYAFEGLAEGTYSLAAQGRGGAPITEQLALSAGEQRALDPTLDPSGSVRVHVVDARGRPLPEALVSFHSEGRTVRLLRPARTDRSGHVTQTDLPTGPLQVRARTKNGGRGFGRALVEAGQTSDAEITITPKR